MARKEDKAAPSAPPPGKLYVVATPIGNARDMSPRGREILEAVQLIAAEDTRRSVVLLNKLGVRGELKSNHKYNERGKARYFVEAMRAGADVALITDAGTPCVSDPGNELVAAAAAAGLEIVGVPGPCAAVTALSVSGFDLRSFAFMGFFPRERAERLKTLEALRRGGLRVVVFYESPKRIVSALDFLVAEGVDAQLCLCNDLSKRHEHSYRGTPAQVREALAARGKAEKGEYVLVMELARPYMRAEPRRAMSPEAALAEALANGAPDLRAAVAEVAAAGDVDYGKNELKAAALRLKKLLG